MQKASGVNFANNLFLCGQRIFNSTRFSASRPNLVDNTKQELRLRDKMVSVGSIQFPIFLDCNDFVTHNTVLLCFLLYLLTGKGQENAEVCRCKANYFS